MDGEGNNTNNTNNTNDNPMRAPVISKLVINICPGEGGERLKKAERVLNLLTNHKPVKTPSKTTNKDFGIRKGSPIACRVTLRKKDAADFLTRALEAHNNTILESSIIDGTFSFGIADHTDFSGIRYDPDIGIFGMDVGVSIERKGDRIKHRRKRKKKLPKKQIVKSEEIIELLKGKGVEVVE